MAAPLLTVVIPTIGRESLAETLASIPDDLPGEVVIVADGAEAEERARWIVASHAVWTSWKWQHTTIHREDESCLGHPQRTLGMQMAKGKWLAFIDDDDVYTAEAFPAFQHAMRRKRPTLFRMHYPETGLTLWNEKAVAHCNVGTPMILTPNDPARLGEWVPQRTGDFDFIRDTVNGFGGCVFDETIVATVRRFDV